MLQTALHDWHVEHNARMVDFSGWHMPIQYSSIVEEHHAVRTSWGLFDIAHMGRLWFEGPQHVAFLDHILTNHVEVMTPGMVRYSLVCNEGGGILDDVLIYRFEDRCLLVVNAANREKIVDWIEQHRTGFDFEYQDTTLDTFMVAAQGPVTAASLQQYLNIDLADLRYYSVSNAQIFDMDCVISRTGYTGEDGLEIIVPNDQALGLWEKLMECDPNPVACGLGCRDTLRLEAAMPLYGHEMDESVDPATAGLMFGVKLKKEDFIGRSALEAFKQRDDLPRRVGLKLEGRRIAREGAMLMAGDDELGMVTSGTYSPTLEASIAMGYVNRDVDELEVDIRGKRLPAQIVPLPFYKRMS